MSTASAPVCERHGRHHRSPHRTDTWRTPSDASRSRSHTSPIQCLYLLHRGSIDVLICKPCIASVEPTNWDAEWFEVKAVNGPYFDLRVHVSFDAKVLAVYEGDDVCWVCGIELLTDYRLLGVRPDTGGAGLDSDGAEGA